jgi:hypothetical protein
MARPNTSGWWGPATRKHRRYSAWLVLLLTKVFGEGSSYSGTQSTFWSRIVQAQEDVGGIFLWITDDTLTVPRSNTSEFMGRFSGLT